MFNKVFEKSHQDDKLVNKQGALMPRNYLANVHGFSPLQLLLEQNPNLASTFSNKPPV